MRMRNSRSALNSNLILHDDDDFEGYPVNTNHGSLIRNYLEELHDLVLRAIDRNSKTLVIGVCLRIPEEITEIRRGLMPAFTASFKAQLDHHAKMTEKRGTRAHRHDLRYAWAKERNRSEHDHYHLMLFLNGHAYHTAGSINADEGNIAARLSKAWASALRLYQEDVEGLVHITDEKMAYRDNREDLEDVFHWASYLCKEKTKYYGGNGKSFGYSQN